MVKSVLKLSVIIVSSLLLLNCSDPPKSIGINLIDSDLIEVVKITSDSLSQSSEFFQRKLNLGLADRLLLGKIINAEASVLIQFRFSLADSIRDDLLNNNINVTSARIELLQNYYMGDENAAFDFTVHKVNSDWSIDFNADSLEQLNFDAEDVSGNKEINDSVTIAEISKELVKSWLDAAADTNVQRDKGVYIKPTDNTEKVRGYQALTAAFTNLPVLRVIIEKPGAYIDTLRFTPDSDVGVVKGNTTNISPENIAVQGGVAINSKLYFDISKIPSTGIINSAELVLTIDTTETVLGPGAVQAVLAYYLLDANNTDSVSTLTASLSRSGNTLKGDITRLVYLWFSEANHGLILRAFNENTSLDLFSVKGSNASDQSLKPYLEITYTNKK